MTETMSGRRPGNVAIGLFLGVLRELNYSLRLYEKNVNTDPPKFTHGAGWAVITSLDH
jgi:hypothetical protein